MFYINGRFLTQPITGVQRFGIEVTKELDKIVSKNEFEVLAPPGVIHELNLKNINVRIIGKKSNNIWVQWTLPNYVKKHKGKILTMSGMAPILNPGYFVAHDATFCRYPSTFSKSFVVSYSIDFKLSLKRCNKIFTISNFSKTELKDVYGLDDKMFEFVSPSSHHLLNTSHGSSDLNKWNLLNKKYYLSVSSQTIHKNQVYIYKLAEKYPNETFVIVGGKPHTFANVENRDVENLLFTGYVTNDELFALYNNAYGFIFPSLYEGFGLPPLEAITMGVKHIGLSNIDVFKEVYDRGVYRFDPKDIKGFYIKKMDEIEITKEDVEYYWNKYSWEKTARTIYETMKQ